MAELRSLPANTPFISTGNQGNADLIDGNIVNITASTTPDETWTGEYLLFPIDVVLFKFVNQFSLLGSNTYGLLLESYDTAEIPPLLKFRFTLNSPSQSDIKVLINIFTYRHKTI